MIQILEGNLRDRDWPRVDRRRNDDTHIYCLHVSPLHAMVIMITGANAKGQLS